MAFEQVMTAMLTHRRIERRQLPGFLRVFNRFTDTPVGYLGNVSEQGLMLISQLPLLVGGYFQLRLKVPGLHGSLLFIDLEADCLWCREDATPGYFDSGFVLREAPGDYVQLIRALSCYFSFRPLPASA